jgi:hypothetical protein
MKPADQVRDCAYRTYVKPARDAGQETVRIRCGDIHSALGFVNRHPLVCAALGAMKFRREHAMELVGTEGPMQSPTLIYTFRLLSL